MNMLLSVMRKPVVLRPCLETFLYYNHQAPHVVQRGRCMGVVLLQSEDRSRDARGRHHAIASN